MGTKPLESNLRVGTETMERNRKSEANLERKANIHQTAASVGTVFIVSATADLLVTGQFQWKIQDETLP